MQMDNGFDVKPTTSYDKEMPPLDGGEENRGSVKLEGRFGRSMRVRDII